MFAIIVVSAQMNDVSDELAVALDELLDVEEYRTVTAATLSAVRPTLESTRILVDLLQRGSDIERMEAFSDLAKNPATRPFLAQFLPGSDERTAETIRLIMKRLNDRAAFPEDFRDE